MQNIRRTHGEDVQKTLENTWRTNGERELNEDKMRNSAAPGGRQQTEEQTASWLPPPLPADAPYGETESTTVDAGAPPSMFINKQRQYGSH